jgi:hypothetical protein
MPTYKPYLAILFDDATYGIWNKSTALILSDNGNQQRVEVMLDNSPYQGIVIYEQSLTKVREYFTNNGIVSNVDSTDIENSI